MNAVLKLFLSMSFSGSLLILALFFGKGLLKDKVSRQWQYYIWLVVVLRLLLPFSSEASLLGKAYQAMDQAITQAASPLLRQSPPSNPEAVLAPASGLEPDKENEGFPSEDLTTALALPDNQPLPLNSICLVWLAVALGLIIRKITIYQSFTRYIKAGLTPVSDMEILDQLSIVAEQASIKKPIELCVNPLVSSPLLIGFFHPCIVLPSANIPQKHFQYIFFHELTHYKRWDMVYKWLAQAAACLHWFNPLVHLMSREITKACEFSCDEAVLAKMGIGNAQDYGKTLLDAMAAVGKYKENPGAVTLSENKQLLKERLNAIMNFKKKSMMTQFLTGGLTLCVMFGAVFVGIYPVDAADNYTAAKAPTAAGKNTQATAGTSKSQYSQTAEKYYEAGNLPLFQMSFSQLDEEAQAKCLDKIYSDKHITFWGVAISLLDEDHALIQRYAVKTYADDSTAYFSTLTMRMSEETLEAWLDKALEDEKWGFQSILFNVLGWEDDFDELKEKQEKEWAEAQMKEYEAVGVTIEGKNYYYQGQLVNVFLDSRADKSFYTLNMNPKGTINIKIVRNKKNEVTGVAYMTEAEVAELFGEGIDDPDDKTDVEIIPVNFKTIAAGESIFLGEYTLSKGDKIWYDIFAKSGKGMAVFFAKDEKKNPVYWAVHNLRQPDEPLKCAANFTVKSPAKPGTYKLYLQATDDALKNVKGSISIERSNAS